MAPLHKALPGDTMGDPQLSSEAATAVTYEAWSPCSGMTKPKPFGYPFKGTSLEYCVQVGTLEMRR